ncbi:PIN domain-containing protein [Actinoplanes sp. CA-131856]
MYLIDSSALVRSLRQQVDPRWGEVLDRGLISVCEPALVESLRIVETKKYGEMEEFIVSRYLPVVIPANVWDDVSLIRRELARRSAHWGLALADLLIAATAIRLKLTVLHEDRDFETIGKVVPELRQRSIKTAPH